MTPLEALQQHRALTDELHQLALEENRHLRQHGIAPGADILDRKRALLEQLEAILGILRETPRGTVTGTQAREAIEEAKGRIHQILQLDKENEQLLNRQSLSSGRPEAAAVPAPSAAILQRIYQKTN